MVKVIEWEPEPDDDGELWRRRARRQRERVARRKLLTKLIVTAVLAVVTLALSRGACAHRERVLEHNAKVMQQRR